MSCIITYNGQNFTQEDFLDYLKSQIPVSQSTKYLNIYAGTNENSYLSNFAIRPFTIEVETPNGPKTFTFKSVEQGFHFYKTIVANRPDISEKILKTTNGGQLKSLTNRANLKMTPEQIKEWDDSSKSIMLNLMYDSFSQNKKEADRLVDTGNTKLTHKLNGKEQDNGRFSEVITTVREMLKEEGFGNQQQSSDNQENKSQIPTSINNPTDQIEAGDHFNFQNSETLLQSVVNHPTVPQYLKDLAKQLLDKINVKNINIETYAGNSKSVGTYNSTTNTVTINLRQFIENKTSTVERISETIVHEYIHAATVKGLKEFKAGLNNNVHLKNINILFEQYRKDLIQEAGYQEFLRYLEKVKTKQDLTIAERQKGRELQNKYYAAYKIEEFITMGLSNPTTRETLKSKNLLQKLFDSIASFLGLDNNTFTLLEQEYGKYLDSVNNNKQTFQEDNISNLDTYQYYGKTYQIHIVDGVGVKVEGYMGSNVKQQALLAAYNNNKDVDPQTGRKFRNLSPLKELEQKITGIGTSTVVKKEFSFTHNDVTIPTDFQLGEQQEEALKQIIDFIEGNSERAGEPFFTLQGFAGTGKTTVIGYVQKYFEAKKSRLAFRYVAPTHAATAQLAVTTSRLGNTMLPSTVRSSVFEKKDLVTGDITYSIARKLKIGDFDTPIFIVDETSMLPQKDLDLLIKRTKI